MDHQNVALNNFFVRALKRLRKQAGWSQEELAHRLDLSVSYIS